MQNTKEIIQDLKDLDKRINDTKVFFSEVGNHLVNIIQDSFENEKSPTGINWLPLKASTVRKKAKNKKLFDSGDMQSSLNYKANKDSVTVGLFITTQTKSGDNFPYPAVHQFGSDKRNIPAREFLPIKKDGELLDFVVEDIFEILGDLIDLK